MANKELTERTEDMLRSFDEKIDAATHAAMQEFGLDVLSHQAIADEINDYLNKTLQFIVAGDEGAERHA